MGQVEESGVHIPYHFRCPVSLEVMSDPVTISTGQTYDRASIESWLAMGNKTCPVTRTPLTDFALIQNHTLRRLIQDWTAAHGDAAEVRRLLAQAESAHPAGLAALRRLRILSRESDGHRRALYNLANRGSLLLLAFGGTSLDLATSSLSVLAAVTPLTEDECLFITSRADCVAWLGHLLLSHPSIDTRADCAIVIEAISARSPVVAGAADGVIQGLVAVLRLPCRNSAIRALFSLCLARENRELAVSTGAASSIMELIIEENLPREDVEQALATVELLCRAEGGRESAAGRHGAAAALVKVIAGDVADRAAEHAAGVLATVCGSSDEVKREAVESGVWGWLLLMVQSSCSERAKRKAQTLLKILRPTCPPRDSVVNSDDFQFQPPPRAVVLSKDIPLLAGIPIKSTNVAISQQGIFFASLAQIFRQRIWRPFDSSFFHT